MNDVSKSVDSRELAIRQRFGNELRKELTVKRVLIAGGGVIGLAAILPLAILAVQAGFALAALAALGAAAFVSWKKVPRWVMTLENKERERIQQEMNRHLAALKAEAKKNPIEQAENDYLRRNQQYEAFKTAMEQIGGMVNTLRSRLARTKKEKPRYDLSAEERSLEKMELFVVNRMDRLKLAQQKLILFKEKIDEARTKWEFQLAANQAIRAMNATDQEAKINEILTEVAFDSVQQEFDSVFAKLDVDAAEISAQKALEFGPGMTIDISAIHIDQPEPQLTAR